MATVSVWAAGSCPGPMSRNTRLAPPPIMLAPGCSSASFAASSSSWPPLLDRTMKCVGPARKLLSVVAASHSSMSQDAFYRMRPNTLPEGPPSTQVSGSTISRRPRQLTRTDHARRARQICNSRAIALVIASGHDTDIFMRCLTGICVWPVLQVHGSLRPVVHQQTHARRQVHQRQAHARAAMALQLLQALRPRACTISSSSSSSAGERFLNS